MYSGHALVALTSESLTTGDVRGQRVTGQLSSWASTLASTFGVSLGTDPTVSGFSRSGRSFLHTVVGPSNGYHVELILLGEKALFGSGPPSSGDATVLVQVGLYNSGPKEYSWGTLSRGSEIQLEYMAYPFQTPVKLENLSGTFGSCRVAQRLLKPNKGEMPGGNAPGLIAEIVKEIREGRTPQDLAPKEGSMAARLHAYNHRRP